MLDPGIHIFENLPRFLFPIHAADQQVGQIPFVLGILFHELGKTEFVRVESVHQFAEKTDSLLVLTGPLSELGFGDIALGQALVDGIRQVGDKLNK